jgi:uncharacterized protein (TIGR02145 family)
VERVLRIFVIMRQVRKGSFILIAFVFCCCKTVTETSTETNASVHEVIVVLDTAAVRFYDLAQENLSASPRQVLMLTKDWIAALPSVNQVSAFDSLNLDIELKSGLHAIYSLFVADTSGLSATRGGIPSGNIELQSTKKSKNTITNKKVMIFAPFVGHTFDDLYREGELNGLADVFKMSDQNFDVSITHGLLNDVNSFGQYGFVILETHGLPIGFYSGQSVNSLVDTSEAGIKIAAEKQLGVGAYDYIRNGSYLFAYTNALAGIVGWQTFLAKPQRPDSYRIVVTSRYINGLFPMPNTIILGNFCYSGWKTTGKYYITGYSAPITVLNPIQTAFTNKEPISYYSYGHEDGTSASVNNTFAKQMEYVLVTSLASDGDSTGNANLNPAGSRYYQGGPTQPLYFNQSGHPDYSYGKCNTDILVDERDGQSYRVFCFKDKTWMAQNLNYVTPGSRCNKDDPDNCATYGRLYSWNEAMNSEAASDKIPSGVRGICPKGWHIPSASEYNELIAFNGKLQTAGIHLRDTSSLWKQEAHHADNSSGFSALPGGSLSGDSTFYPIGYLARFLTSSAGGTAGSYLRVDVSTTDAVPMSAASDVNDKSSCRCVKD